MCAWGTDGGGKGGGDYRGNARNVCSSEGKDLLTLHGQGTDVLADTSYKISNCSILFQKIA